MPLYPFSDVAVIMEFLSASVVSLNGKIRARNSANGGKRRTNADFQQMSAGRGRKRASVISGLGEPN
jgi:hypothetical protein